ncbi:hypothetical protein J6590_033681 [Homalodisca vitripennis]|nr:hypothetical protein J6590_033681 [Homalodisca vitripennis]
MIGRSSLGAVCAENGSSLAQSSKTATYRTADSVRALSTHTIPVRPGPVRPTKVVASGYTVRRQATCLGNPRINMIVISQTYR